jgi:hypothetical protein
VPISYDRAEPTRFRVVGFEYSPGWGAHTGRFLFGLLLTVLMTLFMVFACALLAMAWIFLVSLFS